MEWHLQLPMAHYLHMVAGILEFAGVTASLWFAVRRTQKQPSLIPRLCRGLFTGALFAYPLLGFAYLTNHFGALIEPVFFLGFTTVVLILIIERVQVVSGAGAWQLHSVSQFEH